MLKIESLQGLICAVGAGCSKMNKSSVVGEYLLWDKRIAVASRYSGEKKPDITFSEDVVFNDEALRPFVEKLLRGESIISQMGKGENVCILEWSIKLV